MQRFVIYTFIFFITFSNTANSETECPENALQTLFNVKVGAQTGQLKDAQQVFNNASEALNKCHNAAAEQAIAAELFGMVAAAVPENKDKFTVYSKAFEALENNENAFSHYDPTPTILINNQPQQLHTFGDANRSQSIVVRELAWLGILLSEFHPMFTQAYDANTACPHKFDSRAEAEAEGFLSWTIEKRGQVLGNSPHILYRRMALHRLEGIWSTCSLFQKSATLTYVIARLNFELAQFRKEAEPEEAFKNAEKAVDFGLKNQDASNRRRDVKYRWSVVDDKAAHDLRVELRPE